MAIISNRVILENLNYYETETILFLPVFGLEKDSQAIECAKLIFDKKIVPVEMDEIAREGGCLNCITWDL